MKTRCPVYRCRFVSKYIMLAVLATIIPKVVASAADEKESPFVVHGKVTDDTGKPLEGVEVNASCGMGTLFHTGTAKTDNNGNYRLAFAPGITVGNNKLGVGTQVATIRPRLEGWYEVHLGRHGNLMMTDSKDEIQAEDSKGFSGVVAANEPYELNFTMTKAAAIQGRFINEFGTPVKGVEIALTGDVLPPSCSILASAKTDDEGRFAFDNVPVWLADPSVKLKWRFTMRPFGVRHELETSSFEVSANVESVQNLSLESTGDKREVHLSLNRQSVVGKN
jgi:hypothetical protein